MSKEKINQLEQNLNSFDANERMDALIQLQTLVEINKNGLQNVNMHFHSFNSYNAEFWSPERIAWEARKNSLYASGIIDFDVLLGLEDFLKAGELLGLRTSVGIETRAFMHEYADKEIDSPGEPGVSYIAGTGFYKLPDTNSEQAHTLESYNKKAASRNMDLIARINPNVPLIAINYDEVLSLTPSGNATERHIISAYIKKASEVFPEKNNLTTYWAGILGLSLEKTAELIASGHKLEDVVRSKFAKRGGFGYVQPSADTFPPVEEFFAFVKSCGAIPMESWLDGTSDGEKDGKALLELSKSKGAAALNLIPDRNWNIADSKVKAVKTQNLKKIIETAVSMDMPIHIGTEMNKKGLPFVDDLGGADLNPYKEIFLNGARIIVGHTLLARFADFTYLGEKAAQEFGSMKQRNAFFASVGALPAVQSKIANVLREAGEEKSFSIICDSAKQGEWVI
ncbi:hypothetical protein [Carboxylicivirga sp. RSCT41]|uniref:hypothetical protein n=1 Tax=Carboxylicivirga agarovorans TaxID=3417570 RepID=UPI003D3501BA